MTFISKLLYLRLKSLKIIGGPIPKVLLSNKSGLKSEKMNKKSFFWQIITLNTRSILKFYILKILWIEKNFSFGT